jgi:heat shock protein HtpX
LHQFVFFAPVILGGAIWSAQVRFRRKRRMAQLAGKSNLGTARASASDDGARTERTGELDQIRHSQRAAFLGLGISATGALFYPPLSLACLPVLGYGAHQWLGARVRERPLWYKSPSAVLAMLAFTASLATGNWLLASLVLTTDSTALAWALKRDKSTGAVASSTLSRRGSSLRVGLFVLTNLAVLLVLSAVLLMLGAPAGNLPWLALFALTFGMAGSFISLAMSKWIAKKSTGARVIEESSNEIEHWLLQTVAAHARRADIGMPEVAVYESPQINAFATGMKRDKALIAVSTGLIARMTRGEAEAVLGHELAHVANGDMVTLALIQGVLDTFVIFISRVVAGSIDNLTRAGRGDGGLGTFGYAALVMGLDLTLGLLALLVVMWFSRRREFRADLGGAELAGRDEMIAALERLRAANDPTDLPERMAAFGINSRGSRIARLLSSHPPLEERIAALRSRDADSIGNSGR